jgi:hypothetical protein
MPTNIPTKESGVRIQCRIVDDRYEFLTSDGWMIETCYTPKDIAMLLEEVRDYGFKQGIISIRKALGIKQ